MVILRGQIAVLACILILSCTGTCKAVEPGCGAVAAKLFCSINGREARVEELAQLCREDEQGMSSLLNIKHALTEKGFRPAIAEVTYEQLIGLPSPAILSVMLGSSPHFVVVARAKANRQLMIIDPSHPDRVLDQMTLAQLGWQGYVLFNLENSAVVETQDLVLNEGVSLLSARIAYLNDTSPATCEFMLQNRTPKMIKILEVRGSCSGCFAKDTPFSFPDSLDPGQSDKLVVRLEESSLHRLSSARIFILTDNAPHEIEFCDVVRLRGLVQVQPRMVDLGAIAPDARQSLKIDFSLLSLEPLGTGMIEGAIRYSTPNIAIPITMVSTTKTESGQYLTDFSASLPSEFFALDGARQDISTIVGRENGYRAVMSLSDSRGELGVLVIEFEAKPKVEVRPTGIFLGKIAAGDPPMAKELEVRRNSRDVTLAIDHISCASACPCLRIVAQGGDANFTRVLVTVDPKNSRPNGPQVVWVKIPYRLANEERELLFPVCFEITESPQSAGEPRI